MYHGDCLFIALVALAGSCMTYKMYELSKKPKIATILSLGYKPKARLGSLVVTALPVSLSAMISMSLIKTSAAIVPESSRGYEYPLALMAWLVGLILLKKISSTPKEKQEVTPAPAPHETPKYRSPARSLPNGKTNRVVIPRRPESQDTPTSPTSKAELTEAHRVIIRPLSSPSYPPERKSARLGK
jgi:hypothetical protein